MEGETAEKNLTYDWLVLNTIMKIRDAQADGSYDRYARYTLFCLRLLLTYYPTKLRREIQADIDLLYTELDKLKKDKTINETQKAKKIQELQIDFSDAHQAYLITPLSKIGIIKLSEEGLVDFEKHDMETLAQAIRAGGGRQSAFEEAGLIDKKEEVKKEVDKNDKL